MPKLTRPRIIALIIIAIVLCLFQFGIQIGDVRLGKQLDLSLQQQHDVENSAFYQQYYMGDSLVVLNYWATWCKPCIAEMPVLNEVRQRYANGNIAFVSISVDTDSVQLKDFIAKGTFEFTDITLENRNYLTAIMNILKGKAPDAWVGGYSVPVTYIIRGGEVLETVDGTVEKDALIGMIDRYR